MARKNVFVPAMTEFQRGELEALPDADRYAFHSLLDVETLVDRSGTYVLEDLLERARAELAAFSGSIDAIIAHWDFPTSVIVPILAEEHGIPAPSLRSVLTCEHKYWSRLAQAASVPDCVPGFCAFDPFDEDALEHIDLEFPFWIKPVKSFASQLGFKIEDADGFAAAITEMRDGIEHLGAAFDEALDRVELPEELRGWTGRTCIAEEIISGVQAAPEGSLFRGEFAVHGVFDQPKDEPDDATFERLDYPSVLPEDVQRRMIDTCERFLRQVGFDNGCFNVEFMWDREQDRLWIIEVNTRMSQSHSDMFSKVDGASNHEIAIAIALGERPFMPYRQGRFAIATQAHIPHDEDTVVTRVPTEQEIAQLAERFPETVVQLSVQPGDRLSELPNQSSEGYELGTIYLGADDRDQLKARYAACLEELRFEFEPVEDSP